MATQDHRIHRLGFLLPVSLLVLSGLVASGCAGTDGSEGLDSQGNNDTNGVLATDPDGEAQDTTVADDATTAEKDTGAIVTDTGATPKDAGTITTDGGAAGEDGTSGGDGTTAPAPGCCDEDQDCEKGRVCLFGPFNAGKCMTVALLKKGQCWSDDQCGGGLVCDGAQACGCDAACKAMDKPGTCVKPVNKCLTMKCAKPAACMTVTCEPATGKCISKPIPNCVAGGCCANDLDCGTNSVCIGGGSGSKGMCKSIATLNKGQCWSSKQCGGKACKGASVCPCGAMCLIADKPIADKPGTCAVTQ